MHKIKTISYEKFEETYKPIENKFTKDNPYSNFMYETYGKELDFVLNYVNKMSNDKIWTIIDVDGETWIIPGYLIVNRLGYIITEKSWENIKIQVNDNEMYEINECVKNCLNCFKDLGFTLNSKKVKEYFKKNLKFDYEINSNSFTYIKSKDIAKKYFKKIIKTDLNDIQEDFIDEYYNNY